jgi:glycine/serine hydroxymethyltransferase
MELIGQAMTDVLLNLDNNEVKNKAKALVKDLTQKFPIYEEL